MTIQDLQFALLERVHFNEFDGQKVVADLKKHRELWRAALMGRDAQWLYPLRSIEHDVWAVDTLAILSSRTDDRAMEKLARTWNPDELIWLSDKEAGRALGDTVSGTPAARKVPAWVRDMLSPAPYRVLILWWD
jgi:hypothetical protein